MVLKSVRAIPFLQVIQLNQIEHSIFAQNVDQHLQSVFSFLSAALRVDEDEERPFTILISDSLPFLILVLYTWRWCGC